MIVQFRFRRGTAAEWATANPVLAEGEPGWDTTAGGFKIGDGVRTWNDLPFQSYSVEQLNTALASINDSINVVDATVEEVNAAVLLAQESAASAEMAAAFAKPKFTIQHTDPVNGDDTNDGLSWGTARRTLAAAVANMGTGGRILMAQGDYDVGTGLVLDPRVPISFEGPLRPERRYKTGLSPRILSTAAVKPDNLISIDDRPFGVAPGVNYYGFQFSGIVFASDNVNVAAVHGYNVSMVRIIDCSFVSFSGTYVPGKYLAVTERVGGGVAPDGSWWRVIDCFTRKVGLFKSINGGTNNVVLRDNVLFGAGLNANTETPMISLDGGARVVITGNNWEQTWIGASLANCVGGYVTDNGGESIHYRSVLLTDCSEMTVQATWNTGTFQAGYYDVESIRGIRNNIDAGSRGALITDPVDGSNVRDGIGVSPAPLKPGSFATIKANQAGSNPVGTFLTPDAVDAFATTGLTMQYHDGTTWQDYGADTNILLAANGASIALAAGRRRFRVKNTVSLGGISGGLLLLRLSTSSASAPFTFIVTEFGSDGTTVLRSNTCTVSRASQNKGMVYVTNLDTYFVQVESVHPDDGTTVRLSRVALFAPPADDSFIGRRLVSTVVPNGAVTGRVGDTCDVLSATTPGRWLKTSGNNTTSGWVRFATTGDVPAAASPGLYSATATATLTNTTTETVLDSYTIPASTAAVGQSFRVQAGGQTDSIATSGTLTFRIRVGGVAGSVVAQFIMTSGGSAVAGRHWTVSELLTVRAVGTSGQVAGSGALHGALAANPGVLVSSLNSGTSLNFNADMDLVLTAQWATADVGNILRREVATIGLA